MPASVTQKLIQQTSLERVASFDFLRGLAIFAMTFAHCFYHVYDYTWVVENPSALLEYPKLFVGFGLIIAYIGSWNTFFLLISAVVNTIGMKKAFDRGDRPRAILAKKLLGGFGLLFFGQIIESLGFYGYFGEALRGRNGWNTAYEVKVGFFQISTIQMIAWGLIITSILNYFLFRNKGQRKIKRNLKVYILLALFVLILTPFVHHWVDSKNWRIPETFPAYMDPVKSPVWPNEHIQAHNASPKTYVLVLLAGELEPLFPCLATALFGALLGFILARSRPPRKLPQWGFRAGLLSILSGVLLIVSGSPYSVFNQRPALSTFLIQIGGQLWVVMFFLRRVEFRGRAESFANSRFVIYLRRWAMISLTVFWLEIFDILPKWFLNITLGQATGTDFLKNTFGYGKMKVAALIAVFSILWYHALVRLWSRIDFAGSFEWFLIRFQGLVSKNISPRLDVDKMLHHVRWINFSEKEPEADGWLTDKAVASDQFV
jgi:hypothetical protein